MRLLTWNSSNQLILTKDLSNDDGIPAYAILSHTWGEEDEEVTFDDIQKHQNLEKAGYKKIKFCGERARRDGYNHFWVDTCCINKDSHTELSEAITSMFKWYKNAAKCYAYLSDVSARKRDNSGDTQPAWQSSFQTSRWFKRGWTLQELLAPTVVEFFSRDEELLGTKEVLAERIHNITTIPIAALTGTHPSQFSVTERMRWTENRNTKKKEDKAYCLLGIFDVFMTFNYGEGDNALLRLQKKIGSQFGPDLASTLAKNDQTRSLGLCFTSAPLIQPDEFIGRAIEIEAISETLRPDEASMRREQRRIILGGMGGIGKTQLAIAYARRFESSYASVIWLNATSESTLYISLRSIVRGFVAADELEKLDNRQISARFQEWLSNPQNARWLLILDNYDEPSEFDIENFLPNIGHGSILITTRLPDLVTGQHIRIQPLQTTNDSLDILQARSGRKDVKSDTGARGLAERLKGLPLALVTAGAYLRKNAITFQQYLDTYEQRWQVDRRRPLRLQEYQDRTLYTTWNLSYVRLENDDPDAAQVLRLLGYFDNQDIWYELLRAGIARSAGGLPPMLQQLFSDQVDFENVMTTLVDYCFLEVHITAQSYSMHNCVHDWVLAGLNKSLDKQLYWYAFDCVAASIVRSDWDSLNLLRYGSLALHASHLAHPRFQQDGLLDDLEASRSEDAVYIAELLRQQVQLSQAEVIYTRALAGREKLYGIDHTSTLTTVNNLGYLYYEQGKLDEAEQLYKRALAGYEKALGLEHTSTLNTVNNQGLVYYDQGKLDKAEAMYERALAGYMKIHGPDHTLTLNTVNNLGLLYYDQGRLEKAEQAYKQALAGRERAYGPDHTSTLTTVHNLGLLYSHQGKLDEAEQMYERALVGSERTLGPDHTSTLDTVNNLGLLYSRQGKLDKAEPMYERARIGSEKALGPDHILTLTTVHNLGVLYSNQGKQDDAARMFERALAGREKALGPDHISTLQTVGNIAHLYCSQGKLEEAERMYERALVGKEKALGPDHTSTLGTVAHIGNLYSHQDRLDDAERMYRRSMIGQEKAMGPDHISTLNSTYCLANLYHIRGLLDVAESMFRTLLVRYEKSVGHDHPSTLVVVHRFAILCDEQGKLEEAECLYQRALTGYRERLGQDNTKTREVATDLADFYRLQGRQSEATLIDQAHIVTNNS